MTPDQQLIATVVTPVVTSAVVVRLIMARFAALETHINERFRVVDQRFNDMRDLWRAELRRVEEVLDARLKHIEQR